MRVCSSVFAALAVAAVVFASTAEATPIHYEMTGTGTGQIGDRSFTDASIDMVATGDTDNVVSFTDPETGYAFSGNPFSTFTITIGGIGTATILDPSQLFTIQQPVPGFSTVPGVIFGRTDHPPLLDGITGIGFNTSDVLTGYTGATAIGPVTGTGAFGFNPLCGTAGHDACIATTLGALKFASNPDTPQDVTTQTTFTATTATTVPEPATLILLTTGVAILGGSGARRRQSTRRWATAPPAFRWSH